MTSQGFSGYSNFLTLRLRCSQRSRLHILNPVSEPRILVAAPRTVSAEGMGALLSSLNRFCPTALNFPTTGRMMYLDVPGS